MDIRETLAALCGCDGPAGREGPVADLARSLLAPLVDEVYQDKFGNVIGVRRCGRENAPRVVLDAHLDEVGLVITGAKEGFLSFRAVGGIDPRMLPDREVTILSQPPRFGLVAVLPPHVQQAGEGDKSLPLSDLWIDAGLTQKEGEALVGTFSVPRGPFRALLGERVSAKALDDRAGFGALLRTAELLQGTDLDVDLYFMGSCREEVNGSGALTGAFSLAPHCFVAVDVTHARPPDGPKEGTFPAGEGSKSLEEYDRLCRRLVQLGLTRSDGILALGGGVTGDLAGFAAATLLRGVALVQAPTTLLAQVDSAVGGKTGLDLPEGKNLLGCFYQPRMVLADTVCLATLPWRQLACGMAEVIKYGCIADEELLTRLEQQEPDWPRIIRRCLACKAALVAQDERDEGPRRLLNFGHTFGHAMEALGGGRYTHGECVAAGMMEMLRWQTAHGSDQTAMLARLGTLLERYDLPRRLDLPETAWRQYLLRDKKRSGGEMTIAVLERPGHGVLWSVTPEELLEETRWM